MGRDMKKVGMDINEMSFAAPKLSTYMASRTGVTWDGSGNLKGLVGYEWEPNGLVEWKWEP